MVRQYQHLMAPSGRGGVVKQQGVASKPKDRGAEQGAVEAPELASLALGGPARGTREVIHVQQRKGLLPWVHSDRAVMAAAAFVDSMVSEGCRTPRVWLQEAQTLHSVFVKLIQDQKQKKVTREEEKKEKKKKP